MNAAPPTRRGLRARRVAAWILGPVLAVILALAGIALGLRVASPGEYDTELGRVSVRVTPATHGQVEAYIPLADWGVRFHAFRAPMRLHLEPRTVERDVVIRAASGARAPVSATEAGLRTAVKKTVLRTLRFALGGAALLALMLGLGLAAFGVRRPRVLVGAPAAVLAIAAVACAATLVQARATSTSVPSTTPPSTRAAPSSCSCWTPPRTRARRATGTRARCRAP